MRQAPHSTENPAMTRKCPLPRGQSPLFAGNDGNASNDGTTETSGQETPMPLQTIQLPLLRQVQLVLEDNL